MKNRSRIQFAIVLATAICGRVSYAQDTPAQANPQTLTPAPTIQTTVDSSSPSPVDVVDQSQTSQDVPALDGSGVISMSSIRKPQLLIGGTVTGGYDTNPLNIGDGKPSILYSISPYIGLQSSTDRTQLLLQYHPTISRYSSYSEEIMHLATARLVGSLTPRLSWTIGATGSHGDDSLRLLEPVQSGTAGGGSSSGSFLPNAGVVTNADAGIDLHYDASPRDAVGFRISNSYNSFPALHEKGSVATETLNVNHSLKPTLSFLIYEQSAQYYGDLKCTAVGAGAGVRWQPSESTLISLKGGPQIDTPGCKSQQGFSYGASVSKKLPRRSLFFLTANRQPVISYLGSGLWQDDVSGGYEREFQSANVLSFDAGFVHSSTLVNTSSYHGTFIDSSYTRRIHNRLSLGWSYRAFMGVSGGVGMNRNILQFCLTFTPNSRTLTK